jgi:hypothetical protein
MSYLLYFAVCLIYVWLGKKVGVTDISDTTAIVLAILTAGEVISLRCKR